MRKIILYRTFKKNYLTLMMSVDNVVGCVSISEPLVCKSVHPTESPIIPLT